MSNALSRQIIDSRRLLYFYHVAANGSFSKAEAVVLAPQPVISRHIAKLEEELGLKLLERHGRGVNLTRFGEILFRHAEAILEGMAEAVDELDRAQRQPAGQIRIAASATVMSLYMPAIVKRFMAEFPNVELTAVQASTGEVYNQLVGGKIDLGIVLQIPNKAKFEVQALSVEPMMLVVARGHRLAGETQVTRKMLSTIDLVLPASSHGLRAVIDEYAAAGSINLAPHLQIDSIPLSQAVVAEGVYASILPQSTCALEFNQQEFVMLPIVPAITRSLYAAYLRDARRRPVHVDALLRHVTAVFEEKATVAP